MSCPEYREILIEAARGGEAPEHVESCAGCRGFLARQVKLSIAMAALGSAAEAAAVAACPPMVRPRPVRWPYAVIAGAIAASLLTAWVLAPRRVPSYESRDQIATVPGIAKALPEQESVPVRQSRPRKQFVRPGVKTPAQEPFISIPYTVPLQPGERAEMLRVELPVAALLAAGVPVRTVDSGSMARADLVIGEDGRARAIRLISVSDGNTQRSIYR